MRTERIAYLFEKLQFVNMDLIYTSLQSLHNHQNVRSWCTERPGNSAILSLSWFGPDNASMAKRISFSKKKEVKSTKKYIDGSFFRPVCFHGHSSTSAMPQRQSSRSVVSKRVVQRRLNEVLRP